MWHVTTFYIKKNYNEKHEYTPLVRDRGMTRNVNSLNPTEYEFPNLTKEYWYMFINDLNKNTMATLETPSVL